MGISVFSCVCLCVVQRTGVFGLIYVKARERFARLSHFLRQICHHKSAERSRDQSGSHNNVTTHKRQDGQMNE